MIDPRRLILSEAALHPDWSVRKLAKHLWRNHPDKFTSINAARWTIRRMNEYDIPGVKKLEEAVEKLGGTVTKLVTTYPSSFPETFHPVNETGTSIEEAYRDLSRERELADKMGVTFAEPAFDGTKDLPDYPEETEGTRIAREVRKECNHLSREERDRLLKVGMGLIESSQEFTSDKKVGNVNWREGLELASEIIHGKRKASFNQSEMTIEFPDDKEAVHFINLGDLHFFSSGTNHEAIIELTEAILAEPNLNIVCLGDIIENAINLRGVAEVQSNLMPTGYQLAIYEDWLNTIKHKVLFATHDNHASERFEKNAGVDMFGWITGRVVPFFDGIAHIDAKLGDQTYKIMATHKVRGRSQSNSTHGLQRYGRFDAQDREVLLAADSHVPGVSKYKDGDRLKLAVNVGTLNTKSAYARRYFSVYSSPVFPIVTLYRDRHDFSGWWTLEEWSACFGNKRKNN